MVKIWNISNVLTLYTYMSRQEGKSDSALKLGGVASPDLLG